MIIKVYKVIKLLNNMVKDNESRTIRISQKVYDYLDNNALRATETFDQILMRLLKIK